MGFFSNVNERLEDFEGELEENRFLKYLLKVILWMLMTVIGVFLAICITNNFTNFGKSPCELLEFVTNEKEQICYISENGFPGDGNGLQRNKCIGYHEFVDLIVTKKEKGRFFQCLNVNYGLRHPKTYKNCHNRNQLCALLWEYFNVNLQNIETINLNDSGRFILIIPVYSMVDFLNKSILKTDHKKVKYYLDLDDLKGSYLSTPSFEFISELKKQIDTKGFGVHFTKNTGIDSPQHIVEVKIIAKVNHQKHWTEFYLHGENRIDGLYLDACIPIYHTPKNPNVEPLHITNLIRVILGGWNELQ